MQAQRLPLSNPNLLLVRGALALCSAVVLLVTAGMAHAQAPAASAGASSPATLPSGPDAGTSKGEALAAKQFQWLDTNGDGYLSREEVALFPRLRDAFDRADADRDGRVSFGEIRELALLRRAERKAGEAGSAPAPADGPAASAAPAAPATLPQKKW